MVSDMKTFKSWVKLEVSPATKNSELSAPYVLVASKPKNEFLWILMKMFQ